ncbi:MAG: hypothetical protein ACFFC5_02075 [Promethearchaeota archaeon]
MSEIARIKELLGIGESKINDLKEIASTRLKSILKEIKVADQAIHAVEQKLQETERRIETSEEQIVNLRDNRNNLQAGNEKLKEELAKLSQETADLKRQVDNLRSKIGDYNSQLGQIQSRTTDQDSELKEVTNTADGLQREIERTRLSNQQEFEEKQTGLQTMQQTLEKIRNEEAVLDYLLSDAGSTPSEIDIVAVLAQKRQISQRELQEFVSVPPAITMKVLRSLEEKGILFTAPDGFIRLTKPI